jgi:CheY-like chemotaxis protein
MEVQMAPSTRPRAAVLVVDDHPDILAALCETLEGEGFSADTAGSAEAALELLERRRYDALLVDLRMPGTDGFGLLAAIRERGLACPAILTTAAPTDVVRERARAAGAFAVHGKPFALDALVEDLRAAVRAATRRP